MFGKIYEQTFTGSMVGSGGCVFAVWAYVIAHTKPDSLVELNPSILATILGEPIDKIQSAIGVLKAEDPSSRSKVHGGRRLIEKGPFLYFVPNYLKYRGLPNNEARRNYFAEKQRERRQRISDCQTASSNESNPVKQAEAISSTHKAEERKGGTPFKPPAVAEGLAYAKEIGWSQKEFESWYDHFQSNGWKVGGKAPMKDWKAAMRNGARRQSSFSTDPPKSSARTRAEQDWEELQERKRRMANG